MGRNALAMMVVGTWVLWPVSASACALFLGYSHMVIPANQISIGGGIHATPLNGEDDEDTYLIPSVDVGLSLADRAVVRAAIGLCRGGGESELVVGLAAALRAWTNPDGTMALNVQGGVSRTDWDGYVETEIPLMASLLYSLNENLSLFGTAGVQMYRWSVSSVSGSDQNPAGAVGVAMSRGSMALRGAWGRPDLPRGVGGDERPPALTRTDGASWEGWSGTESAPSG